MSGNCRSVKLACPKCGAQVLIQECDDGLWYVNCHLDLLAFALHGESVECRCSYRKITFDRESVKAAIDDLIKEFREIAHG